MRGRRERWGGGEEEEEEEERRRRRRKRIRYFGFSLQNLTLAKSSYMTACGATAATHIEGFVSNGFQGQFFFSAQKYNIKQRVFLKGRSVTASDWVLQLRPFGCTCSFERCGCYLLLVIFLSAPLLLLSFCKSRSLVCLPSLCRID